MQLMLHQHVESVQRMLTAKTDSRGYPVCMTRVELAHSVSEAWDKVSSDLLRKCAVKCGIARWFDFPPNVVERAGLRSVRVDPIIADRCQQRG